MGDIFKQSFLNTISTYLGFGIGAINTLFLYTNFMSDEDYGMIGYLISGANVLMPLLNCGVQNAMVKFFTSYKDPEEQHKFTFLMFLLPLITILPLAAITIIFYDEFGVFLSKQDPEVKHYVWFIFVVSVSMAYFEVFYAWTKVQYKSTVGNFMKEVFHRFVVSLLLFALYFNWITVPQFIYLIATMYFTRAVLMALMAFKIKVPVMKKGIPSNFKNVIYYALLIILAGSIAIVLIDIDKIMVGQFMDLNNVAYYNVAVFISLVIAVPARAMQQITTPITAKLLNNNDITDLESLYKRSSINLYVISGVIFLLIILNIKELYRLLPEHFDQAIVVVFLISLAKLTENILGINNAIIFNSKYYKEVLAFGVFLAVLTVVLNILFIPKYGINGAGLATLIAFLVYNVTKLTFVKIKFGIHPFSKATLNTTLLFGTIGLLFFFWDFNFHPILNIVLKSICILILCVFGILKWNLSEELQKVWNKYSILNR